MIRLKNRGYLYEGFEKRISEVIFCGRESILLTTHAHRRKFILPLATQSRPALPNLKNFQMGK